MAFRIVGSVIDFMLYDWLMGIGEMDVSSCS